MTQYEKLGSAPVSPLARSAGVRTRDGITLATDVYLPRPDSGPGDTILIRLPYDKSGTYTFIPQIARYFMDYGYRVVAQDVRGKFRSGGDALLFVNEVHDGEDTLDWIIHQPWSNGRVAMWGDSYYGYTQWAAAASGHPALKAIAPRLTGTGLGEPVRITPGTRVCGVEWAVTYVYPLTHFHGNDSYLWEPDWSRRDFAAQAEEFMAETGRSISYDQWSPNAVRLPRFPGGSPFAGRSVPALHTIGWWDNCAPFSWADVAEIEKRPNWAAHHYLRIESIDHEGYQLLESPEDRVAERSDEQILALLPRALDPALDFFEVFVRGQGKPNDVPRVAWNLAGTDEWKYDDVWPPPSAGPQSLHGTSDGRLVPEPTAEERALTWVHDPNDLVPSSVDDAFSYLLHLPDEAPIGERADVLVFTSAPFTADIDLAGPVSAAVRVQSTGPVLDCFVRLLDVAADGTARRIARGQQQLHDAQLAETLEIDLGQVGYRLQAGHRLRLHISSSDYPEFLPQPGTGAHPWSGGEETVSNTQTVFVGGPEGLRLLLPVLNGAVA